MSINQQKLNALLQDVVCQNDGVNCLQMINPGGYQNVSVTCKPKREVDICVFGETVQDMQEKKSYSGEFYYGLSPKFDNRCIENILIGQYSREFSLMSYLEQNKGFFMLHAGQKLWMLPLYLKSIVTMAAHYAVSFHIERECEQELRAVIEANPKCFVQGITYAWHESVLDIIGLLPEGMLSCLQRFNIIQNEHQLCISLQETPEQETAQAWILDSPQGVELLRSNLHLCIGSVYYSGVMPRVLAVQVSAGNHSTDKVQRIEFEVERTTFAMVDVCDNAHCHAHPLLKSYKSVLDSIDVQEDEAQSQKLYDSKELDICARINHYLECSPTTHTIAVSSILKTADDYYLFGMRAPTEIDANRCYCTANGQSEFVDSNVDIYRNSVNEDYPTMDFNSPYRVDFQKELEREIIAELGNQQLTSQWHNYGVSFLSIDNGNNHYATKRRMHFNVLASNTLGADFCSVRASQKNASEHFETDSFYGVKLKCFASKRQYATYLLACILKFLYDAKDIIASMLVIGLYMPQLILGHKMFTGNLAQDINATVTLALSVALLLYVGVSIVAKLKRYLSMKTHIITKSQMVRNGQLSHCLKSTLTAVERKCKFHPIAVVMLWLKLIELTNLAREDKRP